MIRETRWLDCAVIWLQQLESKIQDWEVLGVVERTEEGMACWTGAVADDDAVELVVSCLKMLSRSCKEKVGEDSSMTAPPTRERSCGLLLSRLL